MIESRFFQSLLVAIVCAASALLGACGSDGPGGSSLAACAVNGKPCPARCDAQLGCVECTSNADCGAGAPRCVLGRCEACAQSSDCAVGQSCFPDKAECKPSCVQDGDCPGDAPTCDQATGSCLGCTSNTDCGTDKPICEPTRAQCVACASAADCSAAEPACDVRNGECRECVVDADCGVGSLCNEDHKCHFGCRADTDCRDGDKRVCDVAAAKCVECVTNAQCPQTQPLCDGDKCVACASDNDCTNPALPVCKDEECVQCDKDEQCLAPGQVCKDKVCVAK